MVNFVIIPLTAQGWFSRIETGTELPIKEWFIVVLRNDA